VVKGTLDKREDAVRATAQKVMMCHGKRLMALLLGSNRQVHSRNRLSFSSSLWQRPAMNCAKCARFWPALRDNNGCSCFLIGQLEILCGWTPVRIIELI